MMCYVYDYSEGYNCRQQDRLQSEYFDVAKVSPHITILYRHAVESMDGKPSTEEDPHIVKEQLFVISDDEVQDHAVHKVQELVKSYVEDTLEIRINKMHEFTDGCAAQYKSRNCVRDISCCLADFGFLIQRSFLKHHTPKVSRMLQGQILSSLAHSKAEENMRDILRN